MQAISELTHARPPKTETTKLRENNAFPSAASAVRPSRSHAHFTSHFSSGCSPLEPALRNYLLSGPARDAAAPTGTGAGRGGGGRAMLPASIQILAFALALLGVLGTTVATLLPNWKVSNNAWTSIMTPISQMQGLWMDCVWYSSGVFSCTIKNSVLSLPAYLQATRAAMVLSCMVALFGLCLASLGLKCTRWGGSHRAKGHTAIAAGGCFILASFLCLVPASWFTNEVITAFLTTDLPDSSKYQPGGALCVTFISAGFLLAGGVIFCLSCPGKRTGRPDRASSADPDGLPMCRDERRGREPQTEDVQPKHRKNKTVQLQMDKVKQEKPEQGQEQKVYSSPSKLPPKDIKDSYSLQEYV
ncbi:claudin-20-like isoform X2 [Siniperca chuatsi]|uniref:claudin-20-like isoform X2 n=1 Tax=Siniperca chuatsi TaxID=119488 RepID=UPI001CE19795|nr:claudin-20-like isoform X2 [Siniperca chuatsi]XP_044024147.1 claudin-20-like isoform X2 [Siniperca chuatsi]